MSVDFQRLADVRARHSSRRRRWIRGLSTLGVAALIVLASQLAAPILPGRLLASVLEQSFPLADRGASPVEEEARGRVEVVEPSAGIIRVASGFLGLMSVELAVTPDTLIVVGDKEGGLGDLRGGGEVKAVYERRSRPWHAKRVEVLR